MPPHALIDTIEHSLSSAHGCARGETRAPGATRHPRRGCL